MNDQDVSAREALEEEAVHARPYSARASHRAVGACGVASELAGAGSYPRLGGTGAMTHLR